MDKLGEYLQKHGIKPSKPRLIIFDFLYKTHNHPTVDTIYMALSPQLPTLSKTTVYNTLKLFVANGVARVVNIEENEARYDADTSVHGHFKCKGCGGLFDFNLGDALKVTGLESFKIDEYHINLKGYCKVCSAQ
jgi:Fe2+ or Zn2+ uptake regulation protein